MKNELGSLHNQCLRMHENFGYWKKGVLSEVAFLFWVTQLISDNIYRCQRSLSTLGFQPAIENHFRRS